MLVVFAIVELIFALVGFLALLLFALSFGVYLGQKKEQDKREEREKNGV
jgi:hypothetical protein